MRGMPRLASAMLAVLLAGACTTAPDPRRTASQEIAAPSAVVRQRIMGFLENRGFVIESEDAQGLIARTGAVDPGWASCDVIFYNDPHAESGQLGSARPVLDAARLSVIVVPTGSGSRVDARAAFSGTFVSRFSATARGTTCRSTGALEQTILAVARGG